MEINNKIDKEFENLVKFLKERELEEINDVIKQNFEHKRRADSVNYYTISNYYNHYKLWGEIDLDKGVYEVINRNAKTLHDDLNKIEWLYGRLGDYKSKKVLISILHYWLMLDYSNIGNIQEKIFTQYFDLDLIKFDKNEVLVDVGGYIGDSIIDYYKTFGNDMHKTIYSYEIVPSNVEYIKKNMEMFGINNVEVIAKGASSKPGKLYITEDEISSVIQLENEGQYEVETVTIDEDIKGEVTFIKMDIEGAEEDALLGCKKKILEYHPKLALSVYHNNDHLWKLAEIIDSVDSSYKFYLRYYGGTLVPTEYLLYAI